MNLEIKTDIVVLGAGPSGYSAAFRCADLGLNTTLINQYEDIGGVCLNVGCIPSKTLLHFAKMINEMNILKKHGLNFIKIDTDINKINEWKNTIISKISSNLTNIAQQRKVNIINGIGSFIDKNNIVVKNKNTTTKIQFKFAIIASGSTNIKLDKVFNKDDKIWDSTEALKLKFIPNNMLIVGGGIIGLEIGTIYQALGSNVDILEESNQIINQADTDIINLFTNIVSNKFNFLIETKIKNVKINNNNIIIDFIKNNFIKSKKYDAILIAVGRKPNSDKLNIKNLNIETNKGFIIVDQQMRTSIDNIFAIGDVVGQPMLAHKATYQGHIAAEVIYGKKHYFEPKAIPNIAYTDPEIAWVGMTEKEAKLKNINFSTTSFPWFASGRAIISNYRGITKLIFDKDSNKIIGGAIVGNHGGELIGEITLAIEMGCDAEDIALTIHAHPTLYESIGLSAEIFTGSITDLLNKKN